jgi:formylglycine-generating enzyme required for sulfatase activity
MSEKEKRIAEIKEQIADLEKVRALLDDDTAVNKKIAELQALIETAGGAVVTGNIDTKGGDFIGRDQINIYQGRYEGQDPRTNAEKRQIYCQYIAQRAGALPLRGMDRKESDAGSKRSTLSLAGVYTGLDIQQSTSEKMMEDMLAKGDWREKIMKDVRSLGEDDEDHLRPITALEAATLSRKWVLLGDPGSGKTTFVNYLTQMLAQQNFENLPAWKEEERDILPIVVILRDFYRWAQSKDEDKAKANLLWRFICHDLETKNLLFAEKMLEDALEGGKAILMLDGLDEVPPGDARAFVRDSVLAFHVRYGKNRFLVTCRVLSYQNEKWQLPKEDFLSFELAPFSDEKIAEFIKAWYSEVAQKWNVPTERTATLTEKLLGAVQRTDLARLAPNPLLLTVMALVHTEYGELPDSRAQLYQQAVDVLLWRWEQEKSKEHGGLSQMMALLQEADRDRNDLLLILGKLAFEAHQNGGDTEDPDAVSGISQSELLAAIRELHPQRSLDWAEKILDAMRLRAGLLLDRDGTVFTFPHRTFQEYLAGTHLASLPDFPTKAKELVEVGSFWRVVVLLAAGHLAHNTLNRAMPLMLANELCPEEARDDEIGWRRVSLAGETLLELGVNRAKDSETGKSVLKRVRTRLTQILEEGLWTPPLRAEAGDILGNLGDPRFDALNFYLPRLYKQLPEEQHGFVKIPAGAFLMGSKENDKEAYGDERPQHEVKIPYDYWIARYPVTVAQFRAFVAESGYKIGDRRSINENPSWPVRYVNWHEARAYCSWLEDKLEFLPKGYQVRLPTEAEWEKAARGDGGLRYPWGNEDWHEDLANIDDSKIGHPTPVGMYPRGATPSGICDLSGNLWEWTQSLWGADLMPPDFKYPYDANDGRENINASDGVPRVLRGGSWIFSSRDARCACRSRDDPGFRGLNIGFRIIVSLAFR